MLIEIGHVEAIFRYPVKSMGGDRLEVADLGWHGLDGDRRLAFRRMDDRSGFPWLTASKLPDLLLFAPHRREDGAEGDLPTHIRTPDGQAMPVFGASYCAYSFFNPAVKFVITVTDWLTCCETWLKRIFFPSGLTS